MKHQRNQRAKDLLNHLKEGSYQGLWIMSIYN